MTVNMAKIVNGRTGAKPTPAGIQWMSVPLGLRMPKRQGPRTAVCLPIRSRMAMNNAIGRKGKTAKKVKLATIRLRVDPQGLTTWNHQ